MLVLETIAKIRRAFFVQGKSIKLICRELGVSRKVVRKVVRSQATEFRYEREAQPLPKIGPWTDQLDEQTGYSVKQQVSTVGTTTYSGALEAELSYSISRQFQSRRSAGLRD